VADHIAVSVTQAGREAMRTMAVLATTATGRRVSMSDAAVGAATLLSRHMDEYREVIEAGRPG
jgi:hypothetical protein